MFKLPHLPFMDEKTASKSYGFNAVNAVLNPVLSKCNYLLQLAILFLLHCDFLMDIGIIQVIEVRPFLNGIIKRYYHISTLHKPHAA